MKTTLIFSTLVLFAAFMGCSDNLNVTDPLSGDSYSTGNTNHNSSTGDYDGEITLIGKLKDLSVSAADQYMAENKAVFTNQHIVYITNYLITFDAYTDADKFTNGYRPLVKVARDGETVFESSAFPEAVGDVATHVEVRLDNVRFSEIEFYAALIQGDGPPVMNEDGDVTTLTLSNIKIYKFD